MVYLGEGPSDIPCVSAVKSLGGNCVSMVGRDTVHKGYELARGERTTVGPYTSSYHRGSDLCLMLDTIINKIGYQIAARKKGSKVL